MNPKLMEQTGFTRKLKMVLLGKCPFCGREVDPNSFRNTLSEREYRISGLCQSCQNKTFGQD